MNNWSYEAEYSLGRTSQDFSGDLRKLRVISMLDHRENSVENDFKKFQLYKVGQKLDCFESW